MNDSYGLAGKVVVVTGGSRGLGAEMVRGFAQAGARPVIVSRRLGRCEELAAEVREATGVDALAVACNVSIWDDVSTAVDTIYREAGRIDVLINNAGASPLYPDISAVSEQLFDKVFGLNLKGVFRFSQLVGPRMLESGGGVIVNFSSNSAPRPLSFSIPYSAAKAGVENMTVAFAHLLGPTVRVNCIRPGMFLTDVSKAWDPEETAQIAAAYALRRPGQPAEIVGMALYLASDVASYTSGGVFPVDGGIP